MYKSKYANLMQHLMNEYDLILLDSEQQEIEKWVEKDLKAINNTPCCDKLKDIEILIFDAWVDKYYRSVLNGYIDKKTEEFKTKKEILKIYEDVEQSL